MGNETQYCKESQKLLDTKEKVEKHQCKIKKSPACTLVYVPELDELVVLTEQESLQYAKIVDQFNEPINALIQANKLPNSDKSKRAKVVNARKNITNFINNYPVTANAKAPAGKAQNIEIMPGIPGTFETKFIEIYSLSGKTSTYFPRHIFNTYRTLKKAFPLATNTASYSIKSGKTTKPVTAQDYASDTTLLADDGTKDPDKKGKIDKDKVKNRFMQAKLTIEEKWEFIKPKSGQIPSKLIKYVVPMAGVIPDEWFNAFDEWIDKINDNLQYHMNDKEKRRKELISVLDKNAKRVDKYGKQIDNVFGQDEFGWAINEIQHIWDQSERLEDRTFAKETLSPNFLRLPKGKENLEKALKEKRDYLHKKTEKRHVPPYRYNVTAEAQFMRYTYGGTATVDFDLREGKFNANASASVDLALAEGKVTGKTYLPDSDGANINLPKLEKYDVVEFKPVEHKFPSDHTFIFNKTYLRSSKIREYTSLGNAWRNFRASQAKKGVSDTGYKLKMIGHADAISSDKLNQDISSIRAEVVYGFMTLKEELWLKQFYRADNWKWGIREIQDMLAYVTKNKLTITGKWDKATKITLELYVSMSNSGVCDQVEFIGFQTPINKRDEITPGQDLGCSRIPLKTTGVLNYQSSAQDKATLRFLIIDYMRKGTNDKFIPESDFMDQPYEGRGETQLAVDTQQKEEKNRRVEYEMYLAHYHEEKRPVTYIPLGAIRVGMELYLSGYAGANAMVAADLNFDVSNGMMSMQGVNDASSTQTGNKKSIAQRTGAGGKVSAFAGAKATLGCKGELDWKCPEPDPDGHKKYNKPLKLNETLAKEYAGQWRTLGSVGYSVTGTAGAAFKYECKIGYDTESGKFTIKTKAEAALGLGCGGGIEFTVGVQHVYYFITFVYTQIRDHDYGFVDFIEGNAEEAQATFDKLCAWSYEMLLQGKLSQASVGAIGIAGLGILQGIQTFIENWNQTVKFEKEAAQIMKSIKANPNVLLYTVPEVKGRMLHALYESVDVTSMPFHEKEEEAALKILEYVQSKRDYNEVLEHMGVKLPKGPTLQTEFKTDAEEKAYKQKVLKYKNEQAAFRKKNRDKLIYFFNNSDETKFLKWERQLPAVAPKSTETGPVRPRSMNPKNV